MRSRGCFKPESKGSKAVAKRRFGLTPDCMRVERVSYDRRNATLSRVVEPSSQKSLDADFRFLWEPSFRPQSLRGAPAWVSGPRTTAGCLLGQFLGQRPTGTNATQRGHVGHVVQSHRLRDYLGPDRPETREEGFVRGPHHALREPGFRGWREQEPPELETQRAPQTSVQRNPR
jgi:hypothetical protein